MEKIDPFSIRITTDMMGKIQTMLEEHKLHNHLSIKSVEDTPYVAVVNPFMRGKVYKNVFPFLVALALEIDGTVLDAQLIDKDRHMTLLCGGKVYTLTIESASMRNDEGSIAMEVIAGNENDARRLENFIGMLLPSDKLVIGDSPDLRAAMERTSAGLNINLEEAKDLVDKWHEIYPGIKAMHEKFNKAILETRQRHQLYPLLEDPVRGASTDLLDPGLTVENLSVESQNDPSIVGYQIGDNTYCLDCIDKIPKGIYFSIKKGDPDWGKIGVPVCYECNHEINTIDEDLPSSCECDNTHEANDTVCRWCYAYGRRKWDDPKICNCCLEKLENLKPVNTCGEQEYWCDECMEQEGITIEHAPTPGDECPNCKHGTVERVDNEIRCRGECGTIWEIKPEITWEPESHWSEHPNWSVEDWKNQITEDSTRQGYHEWVRSKIEQMLEEAKEKEEE